MKNKAVGYLVIVIAVIVGIIIFSYNRTVLDLATASCSIQGPDCPHLK